MAAATASDAARRSRIPCARCPRPRGRLTGLAQPARSTSRGTLSRSSSRRRGRGPVRFETPFSTAHGQQLMCECRLTEILCVCVCLCVCVFVCVFAALTRRPEGLDGFSRLGRVGHPASRAAPGPEAIPRSPPVTKQNTHNSPPVPMSQDFSRETVVRDCYAFSGGCRAAAAVASQHHVSSGSSCSHGPPEKLPYKAPCSAVTSLPVSGDCCFRRVLLTTCLPRRCAQPRLRCFRRRGRGEAAG